LVFNRASDGALSPAGSFATNGMGSGTGLGNQNGVIISSSGRELLVVNAASNSVTSFRIRPNGSLERVGTWPSGGMQPISIAEWGGVVYVLNAGGSGGIAGFRLLNGRLSPIAGSARALSQAGAGPAQIQFARGGTLLVVTEKATNRITTYTVGRLGVASAPIVSASNGQTPFGFAVVNGLLIVSEAFGGATDASALSSYAVSRTARRRGCRYHRRRRAGRGHGRALWYTTNTGSNSISGYARGAITLLDNDSVTATRRRVDRPAVSRDSKYI
jgi:DNA-binding beta-propeller fold protein YncE